MNRIIGTALAGLLALSVLISGATISRYAAPAPAPTPTAALTPTAIASPVASVVGSAAGALNAASTSAAAAAAPSVVKVESAVGLGSGVIIDARGYIVTNYHVLFNANGAPDKNVTYAVTLASGQSYQARVAGTDAPDDLAVVKIAAPNLRALPLADSAALRAGDLVLAVGNPLGYAQTVTLGIVSTPRRTVAENGPATFIPDMIQTSAPINPGNSGGALVDLAGRLVGIPTLAATDPRLGTSAQGIGFAIPSNRIALITQQIISSGKVLHSGRPYLGISGMRDVTPTLARWSELPVEYGVLITGLASDGPAMRVGLHSGEVLVQLAGQAITSSTTLGEALASLKPGQRVPVVVTGPGGERSLTITLGELPVS
jgi:S1-C subfamily serine protease